MKFVLVFISPNGTTRKTTLMLKDIIEKSGYEASLIDIGDRVFREDRKKVFEIMRSADIVGFGSPAIHMDMLKPMKELFHQIAMEHKEKPFCFKAFFYLNYAGITSGKAFENAKKIFCKMGIPIIGAMRLTAPHFHHKIIFPSEADFMFTEEFFSHMKDNNFKPIDKEKIDTIFSPEKKRVNFIYPLVHIIGKKRELPITVNETKCKACKKCLRECPAGAIKFNNRIEIDHSLCLHCYHCVSCCPFKAVDCPIEKIDDMIKMNKKILGTENPLNKIYI